VIAPSEERQAPTELGVLDFAKHERTLRRNLDVMIDRVQIA
jgi:hypothetical protein